MGRLRLKTGGGRFVPIPGQGGARIDRRILPGVLYMIRRYKIRIGDGYSLSGSHTPRGEHPLGLAVDIYPGAGGSWGKVTRLARWAEPRQNRPRPPVQVGGLPRRLQPRPGNHLHLSWQHSPGRRGRAGAQGLGVRGAVRASAAWAPWPAQRRHFTRAPSAPPDDLR